MRWPQNKFQLQLLFTCSYLDPSLLWRLRYLMTFALHCNSFVVDTFTGLSWQTKNSSYHEIPIANIFPAFELLCSNNILGISSNSICLFFMEDSHMFPGDASVSLLFTSLICVSIHSLKPGAWFISQCNKTPRPSLHIFLCSVSV